LVRLREPADPRRRGQLESTDDLFVGESFVTDYINLFDFRRIAFGNGESDFDGLVIDRNEFVIDADAVLAVRVVLPFQLLQHLVQLGFVEHFAFGKADFFEALEEIFGLDRLVTLECHIGDRFAFADDDDQYVAVAFEPHILEETGLEQGSHRVTAARIVDGVADTDREVIENGAGRDAIKAFDPDVVNDEGLRSCDGRCEQHHHNPYPACYKGFRHKSIFILNPSPAFTACVGCRCRRPIPSSRAATPTQSAVRRLG